MYILCINRTHITHMTQLPIESDSKYLVNFVVDAHVSKVHTTNDVGTKTPHKYLIINTPEIFDKFTEKYGYLKNSNNPTLGIKWTHVAKDFVGIYLKREEDGTDKLNRYAEAPYKGTKYHSWWKSEHLETDGFVMFDV